MKKIIFKVVQMKFIAMHITNQKLCFDMFTVGNVQNVFMEHDRYDFWHKITKCIVLTHTMYCCLYTGDAYDCVCAPATHEENLHLNQTLYQESQL